LAQKKSTEELIKFKYANLKQLMGVSPERQFTILYDSTKYENDILADTSRNLDYNNRIEYKQLLTALKLQDTQISYYKWAFLPTLSAFYNYTPLFMNNQFGDLYKVNNPGSVVGMKLTFPLFQGMYKIQNLSKARLQYERLQLGMDYLKSELSSEYSLAMSAYISNLNELNISKKNVSIAKNIYNTVKFQYDKGIKAYIEVIYSETDLRNAELTYLSSLFQVLSSKVDLERALGVIPMK
jgi:outer membrane protein TolC